MWTIISYIKYLSTESYISIANKKFGENYNIPIGEGTFNFFGALMYTWFSFLALMMMTFYGIFSLPPVKYYIFGVYVFCALMSSNLFACYRIKKKIDDLNFETNILYERDLNKKYLLKKYLIWTLIPLTIYLLIFLTFNIDWFFEDIVFIRKNA